MAQPLEAQPTVDEQAQQVPLPEEPDGEVDLPGATRDAVVVLSWSAVGAAGVIDSVTAAGRPTHPYHGEGNHVTAWAVFVDTVRRAVVGRTLANAAEAVRTLVDQVGDDNEWERLRRDARRARFVDAVQRARAALDRAEGDGAEAPRVDLKNAIAAYLSARNYAPLASGYLGVAQAIGGGERTALKRLRDYEVAGAGVTADALRDTVWVLLDQRTLGFALAGADRTTMPGLNPDDRAETFQQMIVRHLEEVSKAYPRAYRAANFSHARLTALVGAIQFDELVTPAAPLAVAIPVVAAAAAAPEGWSGVSATGAAATITVTAGPLVRVATLEVASRGKTLLGGQGHHLTAHIAFDAQLRRTVVGKDVATALGDLIGLCEAMMALPTFPPIVGETRVVPNNGDPKGIFASAWEQFRETLAAARATRAAGDPAAIVDALPELASAYLCVRNAMPLVAINAGALANVDGEPQAVEDLNGFQAAPRADDAPDICGALWQLLSARSVRAVAMALELVTVAPGFQAPGVVGRLRRIIEVHRAVVSDTWPAAYAVSRFATHDSLRYLLNRADLLLSQGDFDALCVALGFTAMPRVTPRFARRVVEDEDALYEDDGGPGLDPVMGVDPDSRKRPRRAVRDKSDKRAKAEQKKETYYADRMNEGHDPDEEGYSSEETED